MEGETGALHTIGELLSPASNSDPGVLRTWFALYLPRMAVGREPNLPKTIASGGVHVHQPEEGVARLRLAVNISIRNFTWVRQYYLVILLLVPKYRDLFH